MKNKLVLISLAGLLVLVALVGCGSATPTPAPTQAAQVITVIITATPPPPTATASAPSITPLPTVNVTTTAQTAATEPKPTAVAGATKPAVVATKKPTAPPAATGTSSPLPMKFGAPVLNRPIWNDNQKDEVKFPGGAIVFDWQSVGGLNGDECYLVQATAEPVNPVPAIGTQSDSWVTNCGDQTAPGYAVKFTLESPIRVGTAPNYSSVLLNTGQMWLHWSITVVKNLGQCDPAYLYHCKTAPISSPGNGYFLFKRS
jgi:hypothetical protein